MDKLNEKSAMSCGSTAMTGYITPPILDMNKELKELTATDPIVYRAFCEMEKTQCSYLMMLEYLAVSLSKKCSGLEKILLKRYQNLAPGEEI